MRKARVNKYLGVFLLAAFFLASNTIFAQTVTASDVIKDMKDTAEETVDLIKLIFGIVMILGGVFIGYAFFTGNPKARDMVIGYLVVLILYGFALLYV